MKTADPVVNLGSSVLSWIQMMGMLAIFFLRAFYHIFSVLTLKKIIQQVYFIGVKSFFVICLTGAFSGMVLGLQGYYTLVKFGAEGTLGAAVALTLIRELGPVLTAIMITGRAGSAIAAEIGIMRISEQIDALKTMNINPIRFLVSPKLAGALISFPLLTAIFDTVGIYGGYLTGSVLLGLSPGIYFARVESSVIMLDITGGFIKAIFFATIVITICCFQGYYTHIISGEYGAKGVGLSTTNAVVTSSVMIFIFDYILTTFLL